VRKQLQDLIDSVKQLQDLLIDPTGFRLILTHNDGDEPIMDNEEPIVWHESILDEYWNQLEEKIDERKQLGIHSYSTYTNCECRNYEGAPCYVS
jgi:hypothetical protein